MKRYSFVLTVLVAAALVVAVPAIGFAAMDGSPATDEDTDPVAENATVVDGENVTIPPEHANASEIAVNQTPPGQHFAGVVGVGQAELEGEHHQRTFGVGLMKAASDQARANVIANHLGDGEEHLAQLESELAALEAQYESGEIPHGKFAAHTAKLTTQIAIVERLGNQTAVATENVSEAALADRGVSQERIDTLRTNASEMTGQEVAEIARGIAGHGPGDTPAADRMPDLPDEATGPPADRGSGSGNDAGPPDNHTGDEHPGDQHGDDRPGNAPGNPSN